MNNDHLNKYAEENPRRNVAVVALKDDQGNVLLMRSHKLPEHWQPVGGGIDPEDASPEAAAIRELEEELDVHIDASLLKLVLTTPYDFGEGTVYFFEAEINRDRLVLHVDPEEVIEHRWFSKAELASLQAMPATKKYLETIFSGENTS